jgi:hypothetical protein
MCITNSLLLTIKFFVIPESFSMGTILLNSEIQKFKREATLTFLIEIVNIFVREDEVALLLPHVFVPLHHFARHH